jgi:hypothetical protein
MYTGLQLFESVSLMLISVNGPISARLLGADKATKVVQKSNPAHAGVAEPPSQGIQAM